MTALIWKEFREHLKWAVLWLLGLTIALVCALAPQRNPYEARLEPGLCAAPVQVTMTIGAALGGFLLGLVQSVPDGRRDRRSFLMHRPLSRTRLFAGKVLGGLALYFPATLLPLLGAAAWLATPGQFAFPCPWQTLLPGLADVAVGVVFYLAGLLTGWRPARWYGSRGLGAVAALVCAVFAQALPEFGYALLGAAAGVLVLGLAAWGSFLTGGEYTPQPRVARLALAITLSAGIGGVAVVLSVAINELLRPVVERWDSYEVDEQGRILRLTYNFGTLARVTDAAGREIDEYKALLDPQTPGRIYRKLLSECTIATDANYRRFVRGYRLGTRYMRLLSTGETHWVYVSAEQRIRLYAAGTRRWLGTLGPDGFRPPGVDGARFAGALLADWYARLTLLAFCDGVYVTDAAARTVTCVYTPRAGEQVLGAAELVAQTGDQLSRFIAVATDQSICLTDRAGQLLWSTPHAGHLDRYGHIFARMSRDCSRFYLEYRPSYALPRRLADGLPRLFVAVADDGAVLSRDELPPLGAPQAPRLLDACAAFGVPPGLVAGTLLTAALFWRTDEYAAFGWPEIRYELATDPPAFWIIGAACLLLGLLIAMGLTGWLARRYAFSTRPRRWWIALATLLGPGVVLLLLALRDWPAREPCPACDRLRVVTGDACEHCGAPFPPPPRADTNIHEPLAVGPTPAAQESPV